LAVYNNKLAVIINKKDNCIKTVYRKYRLSCKKYFSSESLASMIHSAEQMIGWQKQK